MPKVEIPKFPSCDIENEIVNNGHIVAGMDEVGRGSWAGPLVMAAVIPGTGTVDGVRDSKKIAQKKREFLFQQIVDWCQGYAFGVVTNDEIDEWGMSKSLYVCANRAIVSLNQQIDIVLLDGNIDYIKHEYTKTELIIKGDNFSHCIAAASILAKVHRDQYMASDEVAGRYPDFCFEKNKGYPAPVHKDALKNLGATPLHRISWDIFGENREDFKNMAENALF
jgi:ribonuclease HII